MSGMWFRRAWLAVLSGRIHMAAARTRLFWIGLLAALVLASVVPASASESSGAAAWGLNNDSQLGNGNTTTEKEAVVVKVLTESTAVAGGELHSLALLKTGKVMAWGLNNDGQLGNNTTTTEKEPVEVKKITEAVAIAAGADHSLALLKNGKVMAWGLNNDGQLGNNTTTNAKEPVEVKKITEAVAIAAGSDHSLAVLKNGKVMAWGDNNDGQLGNNTTTNAKEPVEVKKITEATAVAGGEFHSLALLKTGKVMAWGENNDGQLGNGTTTNAKEPVEVKGLSGAVGGISAGANFSLASYATKPANTALPTISGEAKDEKTLTAATGTWTGSPPITYSYQWESCNTAGESCTNISGATSSTYAIAHEQVGHTIRVKVTAKNSAGEATATSAQTATVEARKPSNTALPAISGTAESGQLLTVSNGSWEGTPTISYTYQWETCNSSGESCSNITGATASSYRVLNSQIGSTLRAIVTASNSAGSEKATSAATATITTGPPANTELPVITGKTEEGQTLSASTGVWAGGEPFSYTYQWKNCNSAGESCSNISGATSSTYKLTSSSVGKTLRIVVTAKNSVGSTEATSSASALVFVPSPPSNTGLPAISGTTRDGQTLSASTGTWSGTTPVSYAYQWQSCNLQGEECQNIEGGSSQTYTLNSGNVESTLRVVVTATNSLGSAHATSAASAKVESGAPSELEPPSVSGDPDEGETLQADAGQWGGTENEVAYQWERCNSTGGECADITSATEADYQPSEGDVGKTLRLRVGASNALGAVTAISAATETIGAVSRLMNTLAPSITGTSQSGHALTANAGSWLGVTSIGYTYQWQKCNIYGAACENITGATSSSYTLGTESIGSTIRVRVHASEEEGAVYETSSATQPIAASTAPVVEAPPTVSGTGLVGDKVTATTGTWTGEEPVSYSYQWERCNEYGESCSSISGATASTYTLTESDAVHTVRALVTATKEGVGSTKAVSFPLAASKTTLINVAAPSISGSDEIARALSATNGIWTGEGALTYTYKWERCNEKGERCSTISGATASSYTPGSSDVGKTLKVVVTAEGAAGKESVSSAVTTVIGSESLAPTNLFAPTIEGNLTPGETLTAQTGTWVSSETISYTYQWQKCNEEGEECENISGATSSTYKLIEGDINSTLRVTITGKNSLGTVSAESEPTEVVSTAGPPKNTTMPTISGTAKKGEHLVAGNGTWSGSRPLSYYYRWERCNSSGGSCTSIEGATKPSYTVASGDVGSTLRVEVTAKNSLGSAGSVSTQTSIVTGSEASATSAIELAEKTDPSVLQPATTYTVEGQEVKPAISDTGEQLTTNTSLASSSISKEAPGEFAVNTPDGELSFEPVNGAPNATTLPTIVNGAAVVYAGTSSVTDTIVRPDALGATALLQLRSAEAPTSYSWEVGVGPNQYLEKLSNGDIAVVEVPSTSPLEGSLGESFGSESSEATAEHEGSGESSEAAENTLEEGISGESTLEKLSAAPTASTPSVEPKSGELHPQETKAQYEAAKSTVTYSEEHAAATTLMVIEPPKVMDAKGNTVSSSLSFEEETVTVTISPSGATFPVTAETNIATLSDAASKAKGSTVRHGLSDPNSSTFSSFDSHLKSGPLHTEIARDVVSYKTPPKALKGWLEAVHTAGLQPYITLDGTCEVGHPCETVKIGTYAKYAEKLIGGVLKLHKEHSSTIPLVTLWGAWNEPDLGYGQPHAKRYNPLNQRPGSAALFWKKARAILKQENCKRCTMVAGEFAGDDGYIEKYEAIFRHNNHTYWPTKPHNWGFHDYQDLENYYHHPHNSYAEGFIKKVRRLGKSRIWFSEQGVELQNGTGPTQLQDSSQSEDAKRQRAAASDFLNLAKVHLEHELASVEVVDYYLYKGPSKKQMEEKGKHLFDSALLPGAGVTEEEKHPAPNPRVAYCVLALGYKNGCPATSKTKTPVAKTVTSSGGTVTLNVNPEGLATKYLVEYGTTTAYGHTTTAAATTNESGEQSETVTLSGLETCTAYHYQAEAENEVNEEEKEPGLGGDQIFITACKASVVSTNGNHTCALLSNAGVDCWGGNEYGQLGNGTTISSLTPVQVSGITNAIAITTGVRHTCAVLSGGSVKCWGDNLNGDLGDGTTEERHTPVSVSGVTTAIALTADYGSTCALLSGGGIDCWGTNENGVLGNGTEVSSSSTPVFVSGITTAIAISHSNQHVCALLSSGGIDCWGGNELGELGNETTKNSSTPVAVNVISTKATAATVGNFFTCAVLSGGGSIDCWGSDTRGELGNGTTGGKSLVAVSVSGITTATAVSGGGGFACALLSGGSVDCWGANEYGELGNGTTKDSSTPVSVSGLTTATSVTAGEINSCAVLSGGGIDCWGRNNEGQLGNGTTENSSTPVSVSGIG